MSETTTARLYMDRNEIRRLVAQPDLRTPTGLPNRLMLELLWRGGLRCNEVVSLKDRDVKTPEPDLVALTVKGKGGKTGVVYIRSEMTADLVRRRMNTTEVMRSLYAQLAESLASPPRGRSSGPMQVDSEPTGKGSTCQP